MKNNLLWGVGVLVVVFLLSIFIAGSKVPVQNTQNTNTQGTIGENTSKTGSKTNVPVTPIAGMKTSLGGIFNEKGSYQCEYESVNPSSRTSNTVYISDGRMRGEFRTIEAGAGKSSIVVYDGSYLYVWTEGMSSGKVSQPKTLSELPGIIPEDVSSGRILGSGLNSVSWNCHAWSRVSSMLAKPSYVTFTY